MDHNYNASVDLLSDNREKMKIIQRFQGHFRLSDNNKLIDYFCGTELTEEATVDQLEEHIISQQHQETLSKYQLKMTNLKGKTKKAAATIEKLAQANKVLTVQKALNENIFIDANDDNVKCAVCDILMPDSLSVMASHAIEHQKMQLMPSTQSTVTPGVMSLVGNHEHMKIVGTFVKCTVCHLDFPNDKKSTIERHLKSTAHLSQLFVYNKRNFADEYISNEQFNQWLALSLSSSDIPFYKIEGMRDFLSTFSGRHIPSRRTLVRQLNYSYGMVKSEVVKCLKDKMLWLSIDGATNSLQHYKFISVVIGTLIPEDPSNQQVFVWCYEKVVDSFDATAVVALFTKVLIELYGANYHQLSTEYVKMFVSDGASEMVAAAKTLKKMLPNLITITCLCHALHNLSTSILKCYPQATAFVSALNNALYSSPPKMATLKNMPAYEKQPPKIIASRWGTGLRALKYWHSKIDMAVDFLAKFGRKDSEHINHAKESLNINMIAELEAVATRYAFIPDIITKLETRNLSMKTSIELIDKVATELVKYSGDTIGDKMIVRLNGILRKNTDFLKFSNLINVESFQFLKYAPAGSFDTERSIKYFKKTLSPERSKLNHETTSQMSFIKYNSIALKMKTMTVTNKEEKEKYKYFSIQPSFGFLFGLQQEQHFSVGEEVEVKSISDTEDQLSEDDDDNNDFEEVPLVVADTDE